METDALLVTRAALALAVGAIALFAARGARGRDLVMIALAVGLLAARDLLALIARIPALMPLGDLAAVGLIALWAFAARRRGEGAGLPILLTILAWAVGAAASLASAGPGSSPGAAFPSRPAALLIALGGRLPLLALLGLQLFAPRFLVRSRSEAVVAVRFPLLVGAALCSLLPPLLGEGSPAVALAVEPALPLLLLGVLLAALRIEERRGDRLVAALESVLGLAHESLLLFRERREGLDDRLASLLHRAPGAIGALLEAQSSFFLFVEHELAEIVRVVGIGAREPLAPLLPALGLEPPGSGEDWRDADLFHLRSDSPLRSMVTELKPTRREVALPTGLAEIVALPSSSVNRLDGALVGIVRGESRRNGEGALVEGLASRSAATFNAIRTLSEITTVSASEVERRAAAEIQRMLLPRALPAPPGLRLGAVSRTAAAGGRDLHEVAVGKGGRALLAVVDVTGSHLSVAILMPTIRALLWLGAGMGAPPQRVLGWMNWVSLRRADLELVASVALLGWDPESREVEIATAGNIATLHFSQQSVEVTVLRSDDPPIGIQESASFTTSRFPAEIGDLFVLCSDGVAEALNRHHVQFGIDNLKNTILTNNQLSASDMTAKIARDLAAFMLDTEQADDWSALVAKIV